VFQLRCFVQQINQKPALLCVNLTKFTAHRDPLLLRHSA
jgi:hypothetical protein